MTKKQKIRLLRIAASALLFAAALIVPWKVPRAVLFVLSYITVGYDVLLRAARNIVRGRVFDENFLMSLATVGAFCIGEYDEGVLVMILYQIGEFFQAYAVDRSRKSISSLIDIKPEIAHIERDGEIVDISPDEIKPGDTLRVLAGEKIPVDGTVISGTSRIDTSALTGESVPVSVGEGQTVLSGSINTSGVITVRADKAYIDSTAAKIFELVENSASRKSRSENFITKFAAVYTPCVVIGAVLLAVIPSLFTGEWSRWIGRALTFLVISCPCALVISVPLSFFAGIGCASSNGILVKGACYIETMSGIKSVVFDKTGTLTKSSFEVTAVHPGDVSRDDIVRLAALAESSSSHPIAASIRRAYGHDIPADAVRNVSEISGEGVIADSDDGQIAAGNLKLMTRVGAEGAHKCHLTGTEVHVALDGRYLGHIIISDSIKDGAADAIARLRDTSGVHTVMLTGDAEAVAHSVAGELGIDEYRAELLPGDKVSEVERIIASTDGGVAFVGDGINDAPVISRADVGFAMGALGSDAAIEAADVVLMDDDVRRIPDAFAISRRTMRIVRENIIFALAVKAVVLALGALGIAGMWAAVFADIGVCLIAVVNAMRALRYRTDS